MNLPIRLNRSPPNRKDCSDSKSWQLGVDLGSTLSAAGFILTPKNSRDSGDFYEVEAITNYPKGTGDGSGKSPYHEVPTEIYYDLDKDRVLIGYEAQFMKNSHRPAKQRGIHVSLFKPLLHDDEDTEENRNQTATTLAALSGDKTVDRVTTDFLEHLLRHVKKQMTLQKRYDEKDIVHLSCTVPAVWPPRAKRRILRAYIDACAKAGLRIENDISLWSEPEAATAYVLATEKDIDWDV